MKIAFCLPTRHRPRLLAATLSSFHEMASGAHEVVYVVVCDHDDDVSVKAGEALKKELNVNLVVANPQLPDLGSYWTKAAAAEKADVYLAAGDDNFCLTPHWDQVIAQTLADNEIISWADKGLPGLPGCFCISRNWLQAAGYFFIGHFPFWFSDTWLNELYCFVMNRPLLIPPNLALYSKQAETKHLRDLDFWWGFFNATRLLRVEEAYGIARKLARTSASLADFTASIVPWIEQGNTRDRYFRGERIRTIEQARIDKDAPNARYLRAKAAAEQFLAKRGLAPWCNLAS